MLNATLVPNKTVCEVQYGNSSWKNAAVNYDNVFNAALALFQVVRELGGTKVIFRDMDL